MTVNLESFRVDPKKFSESWNSYNVIRDSDGTLCECRLNYPSLNYDEEKANFLMKVEMLANCQHPAITPLIGFSEGDKDGYLYMLIKEDSLKTIGRFSRYPPEYNDTAKQIILYGIACSLEYLHNKGFSKLFCWIGIFIHFFRISASLVEIIWCWRSTRPYLCQVIHFLLLKF
ncbi:hypothetical protein M9Y10_019895 [Tritrichomonas musculus]|uniref:Protein kinase domain-containing protein n=1 Tax=Tritrichomonas musculus TaxID=1915356 RepID=A0ABR2HIM6_9EUKA